MTGGIGWNLWHRLCKTQYIVRGVDVSYKFWGWGVAKPARIIYIYTWCKLSRFNTIWQRQRYVRQWLHQLD